MPSKPASAASWYAPPRREHTGEGDSWPGLAVLFNIAVHLMILIHQGFWTLLGELSPFNVRHLFTVALTFLPGGLLFVLAAAIQRRQRRRDVTRAATSA